MFRANITLSQSASGLKGMLDHSYTVAGVSSIRVGYNWALVWHHNETNRIEPHREQSMVPVASLRRCIMLSMRTNLWVKR